MAMELSDYMRRVLRWSWLIAVVTVVGGIIALLLTSQSSASYVTSATVGAPGDVVTPSEAQQYVNDFQAAAGSRAVQEAVTTETEVARGTIGERVTVNRVGDSGIVSVSYRTPVKDDQKAELVVESIVENTLTLMYDSRVKAAQRKVEATQATVRTALGLQATAQGQVDEFLAARNFVSPVDELASIQDQITQFRIRETEARASGNIPGANTYTDRLIALDERRGVIGQDAGAFDVLLEQVAAAKQQVVRAQEANESADATAAEVRPEGDPRFGRRNDPQDRAATIWRRTLAVMLACFVLSVLLVAWLSSLTPENERGKAEAESAVASPEPSGEPDEDVSSGRPGRARPTRQPKHDPDGVSVSAQPS